MDIGGTAVAIDPGKLDLKETLRCGMLVSRVVASEMTFAGAGRALAACLYDHLIRSDTGERATALVRVFVTRSFATLREEQRRAAQAQAGTAPLGPATKCLVLLGTAGVEPAWCDPRLSAGHQAIPLASESLVREAPMISRLIEQFGLEVSDVVHPRIELTTALAAKNYNVFHVEHAAGSPYIPAQAQFVDRYGIESVVGFGGMLRSGDLFAVILFSRVHVSPDCAVRFRSVALNLRSVLFRFDEAGAPA